MLLKNRLVLKFLETKKVNSITTNSSQGFYSFILIHEKTFLRALRFIRFLHYFYNKYITSNTLLVNTQKHK